MTQAATVITLWLLLAGFGLSVWRLLRGPSLADRVVALDLIGVIALCFVLVYAIRADNPLAMDVAIVLGIVSFMGTVAFARYLERIGRE